MINKLKLRSTRIIVKCLLGIIILSLIFSTMNSYIHSHVQQDSKKYVAIVNGEKISFDTFQKMYFIEREKQKKTFGKKFFKIRNDEKFIKQTQNYIISELINDVLLDQYAKKLKLQINDANVKQIILNSPLFQKNNKFNQDKYLNYLASINLTHNEYYDLIKTKVNTDHLIKTLANSNFVLQNEQNDIIKLLSQKRIIKKSIISIDSEIDKQNISEVEAEKYFYDHKKDFYIPEKFKISFVKLNLDKFKTTCSNQEIHDAYLKNIKKYFTKEKKRYSIIQIHNKKDALLISSQLSNHAEDFTKIAKEKSVDPISAKKGGDIGWMSKDITPNEITRANLKKIGQISDIIPFQKEFLIVKLDDIQPAAPKKINEVSNLIKKQIQYKKSLHLYNNFIHTISTTLKNDPKKIELILKQNNILIERTKWFDKNSIPADLNHNVLKEMIFHKKLLQNHDIPKAYFNFIVLQNKKSFLIKLNDFQNKKIATFQNVRKNIIHKLKIIKAIEETQKKAKNIINELKKGQNDVLTKYNLHFTAPEVVSRYDTNSITSIIFSLPRPTNKEKQYILYQDHNKNFVILLLDKVYNENFSTEERKVIAKYIAQNNIDTIFNSVLKSLREKSIITYNEIKNIN